MNVQQLKEKRKAILGAVDSLNTQLADAATNGLRVEIEALPVETMGSRPRQMLVAKVLYDVEAIDE